MLPIARTAKGSTYRSNIGKQFAFMVNRRMIIGILIRAIFALLTAILVWRSRILQVGTFLTAAGLRRNHRKQAGPASKCLAWKDVVAPATASTDLNPRVLITYHPEYHLFEPRIVVENLKAATRLGVGWVRSDIHWSEIIPEGLEPDPKALAWYRSYLRVASDLGLKCMAVLSNPPKFVLKQQGLARLESWTRFVELVVSELGEWCPIFQLMNEPNNPVYGFLSLSEVAAAVARGATAIHSVLPSAKVAINIAMDVWGWQDYLTSVMDLSKGSIDIVGLDHYPGTWTVVQHARWDHVTQFADAIASAPTGSLWSGRGLSIIETGYSTNAILRGQSQQAEYFESIKRVATYIRQKSVMDCPIFGIYELCDSDSSAWLDPEAHFGLMTSDGKAKSAFATVREIVASL